MKAKWFEYLGEDAKLQKLMKTTVRDALKIPRGVDFGSQSGEIDKAMAHQIMRDAKSTSKKPMNTQNIPQIMFFLDDETHCSILTFAVSKLLWENVKVNVMIGQLDLLVPSIGVLKWIENVNWPGAENFRESKREPIVVNNVLEGYYRDHENLSIFWVNRAGHTIAIDNPVAMDWIVQRIRDQANVLV